MSDNCILHPAAYHTETLPWVYLFLALLGFLTNGLVLFELWKTQKKPTTIFSLNMVVSDIILCISLLFRVAYHRHSSIWKEDNPLCKLTVSISITIFYVNIYCNMCFLLWTSINRYVTVVQPRYQILQAFKSPQKCSLLSAATWIVFLVMVIARVVWMKTMPKLEVRNDTCFSMMEHYKKEVQISLYLGILLFFFILGVMLVSYCLLLYHLQKIHRTSCVSAWFGPGGGLRVKRKIMASVLIFLACFLPHHIQRSIMAFSGEVDCSTAQTYSNAKAATILVATLNCCLNPILHLVLRLPCCHGKRPNRKHVAADCSRNQVPQIYITEVSEKEVGPT